MLDGGRPLGAALTQEGSHALRNIGGRRLRELQASISSEMSTAGAECVKAPTAM